MAETAVREPLDVMVATFEDREAAENAYDALKGLAHEGRVRLEGAVVAERDAEGRFRLIGMKMPMWMSAAIAATALLGSVLVAGTVFLLYRSVRGLAER